MPTTTPSKLARITARMDGLTDGALDALEARGIDVEVAVKLGVVSVRVADRNDDREWIGFRHHVDGAHDHWAYRVITGDKMDPTRGFSQSSGTERRLWNNQCIRDSSLAHVPLIITEGHLDALACMTAGFERVVSVPDGALDRPLRNDGREKFRYLEESGLDKVEQIIIATDADHPGRLLHEELAIRLGRARCRWVDWPAGRKDANEVQVKDGSEALVRLINGAKFVRLDGLYTVDQLPPEPDPVVYEIGMPGLDDMWKLEPGNLGVLLGIPNHGKSALITDVCCRLAERHGWVIALGSFEDKLRRKLIPRLQRWYLQGDPFAAAPKKRAEALDWVREHFVFLKRDTLRDGSVDWLCERAEWAVARHNVRMVVVDPWNKLNHVNRPDYLLGTEYVGMALEQIDQVAEENGFYTLISVHPSKPRDKGKDGKPAVPSAYDADGSANWVNAPDNGITVYRDGAVTTIASWKSRDQDAIGNSPMSMTFVYDRQTARYYADPKAQ